MVWRLPTKSKDSKFGDTGSLIAINGRNQALLAMMGFDDNPLRLWDQDKREMTELKKMPTMGWRSAWGDIAWNDVNGVATIWNLEKRARIRLPGSVEKATQIVCDERGTRLFALLADGSVEGFDLTSGHQTCRLRPPEAQGDKRVVLSADGCWLFWQTSQAYRGPRPKEYVLAVFDVGGVSKAR